MSLTIRQPRRLMALTPFNVIVWVAALASMILILLWQSLVIPRIYTIEPELPAVGGIITVRGRNFGTGEISSSVVMDGIEVDESLTIFWRSDSILLRVPRGFDSGLVTVNTPFLHSAPVMLITKDLVPEFSVSSKSATGPSPSVLHPIPSQGTPLQ